MFTYQRLVFSHIIGSNPERLSKKRNISNSTDYSPHSRSGALGLVQFSKDIFEAKSPVSIRHSPKIVVPKRQKKTERFRQL